MTKFDENQVAKPQTTGRFSNTTTTMDTFENNSFKLGPRVMHQKFAGGVVLNFEGTGAQSRVQVNFEAHGAKRLVVVYARFETI